MYRRIYLLVYISVEIHIYRYIYIHVVFILKHTLFFGWGFLAACRMHVHEIGLSPFLLTKHPAHVTLLRVFLRHPLNQSISPTKRR